MLRARLYFRGAQNMILTASGGKNIEGGGVSFSLDRKDSTLLVIFVTSRRKLAAKTSHFD